MRGLAAASAAGLGARALAAGLAGAGAAAGVAGGVRWVVRAVTRSRSISRCSWAVMRAVVRGGGMSCTAGKALGSAGRSGALAGKPTAGNWAMDCDIFSETEAQPPRLAAHSAAADTSSVARCNIPRLGVSDCIAGAICPTTRPAFPARSTSPKGARDP